MGLQALGQFTDRGPVPAMEALCVRQLKRVIQDRIENPLSKALLEGRFGPKANIHIDAAKGQITFET